VWIATGVLALTLSGGPAAAQGLFDMLFGGAPRVPRGYVPPQASSYADPRQYGGQRHGGERPAALSYGTGRSVSYCVRLCDGRFFPIQRSGSTKSVQLCSALCPASKTQVFSGSQIDHAVASNGARYADLANAFVYRQKIVEGCTCNGRSPFGLARIDAASDPTLRQGDIIATADGTTRVNNAHVTRRARTASRAAQRSMAQRVEPDDDLPED
jgi:hypothetical protein